MKRAIAYLNRDRRRLPVARIAIALSIASLATGAEKSANAALRFAKSEDGAYTFDTGVLKGVLRQEGRSTGLIPVTFTPDGTDIAKGEGLFNHYRVFTLGKRYGYGARRWPSAAALNADGSVEVLWSATQERPFEIRATYRWVAEHILDLETVVRAASRLEAFEIFLASYYGPTYTDSRVWAKSDPRGGDSAGFVSADKELGEWLVFPRDAAAAEMIHDGRWALEPHPLEWAQMPEFARPIAIRRDTETGLTVISMSKVDDCFGLFTPYGEEKHISNYLSLFGQDLEAGESASAHARLVVLSDPTEAEILEVADSYLDSLH